MSDFTYAVIGETVDVVLPYSEVCMHMRVAGKRMRVEVREHSAQIVREDGSPWCGPITHGEAGVRVVHPTEMLQMFVADADGDLRACALLGADDVASWRMAPTNAGREESGVVAFRPAR